MLTIACGVFGALLGALRARRAGGRLADLLHYAAVHGMVFALIGFFAAIAIDRIAG
jgi:hypothetical protein